MRVLVDARHLHERQPSGVCVYTIQLLRALFDLESTHEYLLLTSGTRKPDLSYVIGQHADRVFQMHLALPNRLLNARLLALQHPAITWFVKEPVDLLFMPNLNATVLPSSIPTILTVHDLSWIRLPECFSPVTRAWHKLISPRRLLNNATRIITPTESIKQEVSDMFMRPLDQIRAIHHGVDPIFSPLQHATDHGIRSRHRLPKRYALFVGRSNRAKHCGLGGAPL